MSSEVLLNLKKVMCLGFIFLLFSGQGGIFADVNGIKNIVFVDVNGNADYQLIQDAIDAADDFDIIVVRPGFYDETVIIDKPITLRGERNDLVIIDGGRRSDVITVFSEGVSISRVTVQNSSSSMGNGWSRSGIRILASGTIVKDCIIRDNLLGVFAKQVEHLIIENNTFFNDSLTIYPYDAFDSHRPALKRSHFVHRIENNLVNDKPLVYLFDESDCIFSSEIGQFIAVNCSNITLKNTSLSLADFPVLLVFCHDCIIENVTFSDNDAECTLLDSDDNSICSNLFQGNVHGLLLDYGSEKNNIVNNAFVENRFCGVVCEYFSDENIFTENNFIENRIAQAFIIRSFQNKWVGNYWSDWIGLRSEVYRMFPKMIIGTLFDNYQQIPSLVNIDRDPVQIPFEIR